MWKTNKKNIGITTGILGLSLFTLAMYPHLISGQQKFIPTKVPSLKLLDVKIALAEGYYNGLYRPMGKDGAVMAEYYSGEKSIYTVRHGVIGGIFFYAYMHNATREAQLLRFADTNGFNPFLDDHSFLWTTKTTDIKNLVYSLLPYHDCDTSLPTVGKVSPYHSKVCKLGQVGLYGYLVLSHFDPLSQIENDLEKEEKNQAVNTKPLEQMYNTLGYGIPLCSPLSCQHEASTIRTAQFGELEMREGHMQYADSVASSILKAENKDGAIYISYNQKGKNISDQSLIYTLLDKVLNDKPIYNGYIPTNAETMNDSLAFLLQYRCEKYNQCN